MEKIRVALIVAGAFLLGLYMVLLYSPQGLESYAQAFKFEVGL